MSEPRQEPGDPAAVQPWSGAVIAAGAVLAGLALGRSGRLGLAAGVAAAAGMRLLAANRPGNKDAAPDRPTRAPEPHFEKPEGDWVDSDAVFFDHLVPANAGLTALPEPKSLPLLDEDGQPVEELSQNPAIPMPDGFGFPLGPLIWEPGRSVQSRSDTAGETVWFGLPQEPLVETAAVEPQPRMEPAPEMVPPVPESPVQPMAEAPVTAGILAAETLSAPSVEVAETAEEPKTPSLSAVFARTILPEPRAPLPEAVETVPAPMPEAETPRLETLPLPQAASAFLLLPDEDLSGPAQQSETATLPEPQPLPMPATEIVPKPVKRGLPEPRRAGAMPRAGLGPTQESVPAPASSAEAHHPVLSKLLPVDGPASVNQPVQVTERGFTPRAPIRDEVKPNRWPVVVTLLLLLLMAAFLAAGWWRDGELLRKVEHAASTWWGRDSTLEKPQDGRSSRAGGSWMSALPEP